MNLLKKRYMLPNELGQKITTTGTELWSNEKKIVIR